MSVNWLYLLICWIGALAFAIGDDSTRWISIDYGSVKTQYSDLVFVIDTEIDESLLAEIKVKIISLLRRVHLGKDRVRVAIIENGQNSYNTNDYDVESTVICKPRDCYDLATIEVRINKLRRKRVTPCSFFLKGVREVLYNKANGARPPGNKGAKDIVVLVQTFCCDDLTDIERIEEIADLRRGNSDSAIFFIAVKLQAANCRHKSLEITHWDANPGYASYFTSDFSDMVIGVLEQFSYPGQAAVGCVEKYGITQCGWDASRRQCRRDTIPGSSIHNLCIQFGSKKPYKQNIFDVDKEGYHVCAEIKDVECRSFETLGKRFCSNYKMRKELPLFKSYLPELTPETDLMKCFKSMPEFTGCKQNIQPDMPQYMDMTACDAITTHKPTTSTTKMVTPEPQPMTTASSTEPVTIPTEPATTTSSAQPMSTSTEIETTTSTSQRVTTSTEPATTTSTTKMVTTYSEPETTTSSAEQVATSTEPYTTTSSTEPLTTSRNPKTISNSELVTTSAEPNNSNRQPEFTEPVTRRSSTVSSFPIVTFVSVLILVCILIVIIVPVLLIVRSKKTRPANKNTGLSAKTIVGKSAAYSADLTSSHRTSMSKPTRSTFTTNKSKKSRSKPRSKPTTVNFRKAKGGIGANKRR